MAVAFRFFALLLIAIALMLLGADIVTSLETNAIAVRSIDQIWGLLNASSLHAFKSWVEMTLPPPVPGWIYSLLSMWAWGVVGVLGVIMAFLFGRAGSARRKPHRFAPGVHSTSPPASALAKRAATNRWSDSRLMYLSAAALTVSLSASATISRSARRATVRARCRCAAALVPPGSTKEVSGASPAFMRVDLSLQPLDLGLDDAQGAFALASGFGHAQIGAEVEEVVLDPRQHRVEVTLGPQPGQADGGIGLVDCAIGLDPERMLGQARAVAQRCGALVPGPGVDAVQRDHGRTLAPPAPGKKPPQKIGQKNFQKIDSAP